MRTSRTHTFAALMATLTLAACQTPSPIGVASSPATEPASMAATPPAWTLLATSPTTIADVGFQASNGHFVVAEGGGGKHVNANRPVMGPWERFAIIDLNGGELEGGDQVNIRAYNGQFVVAEGGGGRNVNANRTEAGPWEVFTIVKDGGGVIANGDTVSLQASNGNYIVAEGGGGRNVNANREVIGPWERFTIRWGTASTESPPEGGGEKIGGSGIEQFKQAFRLKTTNPLIVEDWRTKRALPAIERFLRTQALGNQKEARVTAFELNLPSTVVLHFDLVNRHVPSEICKFGICIPKGIPYNVTTSGKINFDVTSPLESLKETKACVGLPKILHFLKKDICVSVGEVLASLAAI